MSGFTFFDINTQGGSVWPKRGVSIAEISTIGSNDKIICVWDWKNEREITKLEGHTNRVESVCFSPNGRYIISSGSIDKTICIWDWNNFEKTQKPILSLYTEKDVRVCAFSNNNRQITAEVSSEQLLIYDVENLPMGIAIVTPLRDLDNIISVRCKYCAKIFDIHEEVLGKIVRCSHCNKELQLNNFTVDPIILKDQSVKMT